MPKKTADQEDQAKTEIPVIPAPTCRHHWIIESPRSATSKGRCKFCSAEREFRNSTRDYMWEEDSGSGYGPQTSASIAPKMTDDDEMSAAPPSAIGESGILRA